MLYYCVMNINFEHKLVWVPSPSTGEDLVYKFFHNTGFVSYKGDSETSQPTTNENISYKTQLDEISDTFDVLVTTDNPYRQIVNLYRDSSVINWSLKENNEVFLKEKINQWFYSKSDLYGNFKIFHFLENPSEEILKRAKIIHLDNLENEILQYDFVNKSEFILDFVRTKKIERESFVDLLNYEQAKQVYHNSKQIFDICGYDPFSFTSEKLSEKKQINFIHNI